MFSIIHSHNCFTILLCTEGIHLQKKRIEDGQITDIAKGKFEVKSQIHKGRREREHVHVLNINELL